MAIPAWLLTSDPLLSTIIISFVDFIAFLPTFRKGYHHPRTENPWTYLLSGLKFVVAIAALNNFTLVTTLYPASLVLANFLFVSLLFWRDRKLSTNN